MTAIKEKDYKRVAELAEGLGITEIANSLI